MTTFVTLIIVVMGILQIILFFKVWIMTNDVKALKNKYTYSDSDFKQYIMRGKLDDAYNFLINEIYLRLTSIRYTHTKKENFIAKAQPIIDEYIRLATIMGRNLPEHMTSAEKYWNLWEKMKNIKSWKDEGGITL